MAIESIQAVRQAELNAVYKEKDAIQESDAILQTARQDREELIQSMTKLAREKAVRDLKAAQMSNKERMKNMILHAEKELAVLQEMSKEKEQSAIAIVLEEVIG